jgi:hypothetical protein
MTSALQEEVRIDACSSDNEITLKLLAAAAMDEVLVNSEVRNSPSRCALTTDATTGYGRTKMNVTLGFARVNGSMKIGDDHPTKASIDLEIYPALPFFRISSRIPSHRSSRA